MHGLGNDFIILDHRKNQTALDTALIRVMADRHRGIGCDQLIVLEPSSQADVFMRIYNPDGSESGACGNATRCVAHLVMAESGKTVCVVETISGLLPCSDAGNGLVTVDMGAPRGEPQEIMVQGKTAIAVDMGNPHAVFVVPDITQIALADVGPGIEHDKQFPNRTNVEFVQVLSKDHVRMRVWERGAGITLACGSGACATAVAVIRQGLTNRRVQVDMDGGPLTLEWRETDGHVLMTGPYAYVARGVFAA